MSVVRRFYPEARLKQVLAEPGGITVSQAVERANRGIESVRESCLTAIDDKLTSITTHSRSDDRGAGAEIYRFANEIYAEAGVFGLTELSQAAHSLCQLMSNADEERLPREAVLVHIDSMRALRRPDVAGDQAARAAVLKGLRTVVERMTVLN